MYSGIIMKTYMCDLLWDLKNIIDQLIDPASVFLMNIKCFVFEFQTKILLMFFEQVSLSNSERKGTLHSWCVVYWNPWTRSVIYQEWYFALWYFTIIAVDLFYSLFDLRYQINRAGLMAPSEWGRMLEHRLHPIDELDPWYVLGPSPDPLFLFTTTCCCLSSPPVQVQTN